MNLAQFQIALNLGKQLFKVARNGKIRFTIDTSLEHLQTRFTNSLKKENFIFTLASNKEVELYKTFLK